MHPQNPNSASAQRQQRAGLTPRKPTARSRLSNGSTFLPPGGDQRTAVARRYRDLISQICVDVSGGAGALAETKLQLIRRFSSLSVAAEQIESELANGKEISFEQLCLISSTLTRLASRIGLGRHAKQIPSLQEYLAATDAAAREREARRAAK